ncbi:TAP42-like protein [Suhomyces tanzawaensis NRRL Y-17324]|uniref:TAP42-like protein n=1 Tax=Suhomyces tanzawaensis NRRL Y-17324 TaxID=984487 RepID=A0A1E4SQB8_9ASCO|nr:TAP42-like protein [Suhomyces tanzawaensis NRRL Y-17324]ODV81710.1 TAP42-like protein [Suhomyces tanzawaensis NRRL Y-17324]
MSQDLTISQRYRHAIKQFRDQKNSGERRDSPLFQQNLHQLIREFTLIKSIVDDLHLFSDNESLKEVNTNYIPFLNTSYYLASLLINSTESEDKQKDPLDAKVYNLKQAKSLLLHYLIDLQNYGILSKSQGARLDTFKHFANPSLDEIVSYSNNPAQKRQDKIENYKLEKELNNKLSILDEHYSKSEEEENEESIFDRFDEEIIGQIFVDQLRLFSIDSFNTLETITMEIQVIANRPKLKKIQELPNDARAKDISAENDYGYTPRLEELPFNKTSVSDLLSKQGKILRPFTITSNRQQLKEKVFGTGQVLPSMTVEEYLDYELANGKMMKEEVKDTNESDTDDSEDELEKRHWDDWKDENPKGAGNMKANIG